MTEDVELLDSTVLWTFLPTLARCSLFRALTSHYLYSLNYVGRPYSCLAGRRAPAGHDGKRALRPMPKRKIHTEFQQKKSRKNPLKMPKKVRLFSTPFPAPVVVAPCLYPLIILYALCI